MHQAEMGHLVTAVPCIIMSRYYLATQAQTALAWGNGDADDDGVDSDSDDGGGGAAGGGVAVSQERKDIEKAKEAAEAAAKESAEEKRVRLARDVLMKLDAEERERVRESHLRSCSQHFSRSDCGRARCVLDFLTACTDPSIALGTLRVFS